MRNNEDLIQIDFSLSGSIELDLERIEADPIWETITRGKDLEVPSVRQFLLEEYVVRYLAHEELLKRVPSTSGPADIYTTNAILKDTHASNYNHTAPKSR